METAVGTDGRWIAHKTSWIRSHLLLLLNEDVIYFRSPCILESVFLAWKSEGGTEESARETGDSPGRRRGGRNGGIA